ncbi:MAG: hypothetical protein ACRDMA_16195 [Solirubrobacterales bacterium]
MRTRAWAVMVAVAAIALPAAPAFAHQGNPNFRSEVGGIRPAAAGVEVEVLNFDDSLRLENQGEETVVVEGYEGEPYLRIAADGTVAVNTRSPAYYLNQDRYGESAVPAHAEAKAPPEWETVDRSGQYGWHDHRIHYMGEGTPPQVADEDQRAKIFDYRVPIEVGAERAGITGTLYWVGEDGGFPIAPFVGLVALALLGGAAVLIRRRRSARQGVPQAAPEEAW